MDKTRIDKALSNKIIMAGVTKGTGKNNGGGVSSVVAAYSEYFDHLRYIPTWKNTNKLNKLLFFLCHYVELLFLLCFDRRIKIVHIHAAANASFIRAMCFARAAKFFGKKLIIHEHAADFEQFYDNSKRKDWIIRSINQADKFICLSPSWRDYYISKGVDKNKVILLNNIVIPPDNLIKRKIEYPIRLLFLGWLGKRKGIWDLLKVITDHKKELKGKLILRFGGNDFEEEIKSYISENEIGDIVKFEGWVSGEKKEECLAWSDVFILPSYNEGLPISILEAMAYGMPVISTPIGGIPEVVKDGKNGIIVEPGNEEQIWNAIKFFIDNPDKINVYGKNSLEIVKPYTPDYVLTHLKKIYEELL